MRAAIEQDASGREARAERGAARGAALRRLTLREREVLVAVAKGKLNKQIAGDLGIVEQTVKFHRARIMERMQATHGRRADAHRGEDSASRWKPGRRMPPHGRRIWPHRNAR